ncbi:DUF4233 domain-containing protein [Corynebacterium casei]|uniref:DUF4233 domain-containing protein n=1 Tax=Corynebacterium casei TaxID=160386 RepID=UPI003FCF7097
MTNNQNSSEDISPLGLGNEPTKDPLKGFNGMVSATLLLEAISIFLGLLVVLKIDSGSYWTTFNWMFITILGLIHLVMLGLVRKPWAITAIMIVQFAGAIGGILVHWSITAIMILYIAVWGFGLYLRSILIERMKRGYLTTQHLEAKK